MNLHKFISQRLFTVHYGLKFHFGQIDRSEICTKMSFTSRSHVNADNEVTIHQSEILPQLEISNWS